MIPFYKSLNLCVFRNFQKLLGRPSKLSGKLMLNKPNIWVSAKNHLTVIERCRRCETFWVIWLVLFLDNNNRLFSDISLYLEYKKIPMDKPNNFNSFW